MQKFNQDGSRLVWRRCLVNFPALTALAVDIAGTVHAKLDSGTGQQAMYLA